MMTSSESEHSEFEPEVESESKPEVKSRPKKYKCSQCDSKFSRKRNRNQHELGHSAKNFKCSKCEKTFQFPSQLKKHLKVHDGYPCQECDYKVMTLQ